MKTKWFVWIVTAITAAARAGGAPAATVIPSTAAAPDASASVPTVVSPTQPAAQPAQTDSTAQDPSAPISTEVVRIGTQPWIGYGPWWIADKEGFFKQRGLNVEVVEFTWDQDMNGAFASDHINVMSAASNWAVVNLNQGLDIQAFLLMDASYQADAILAPKTITDVKQLKGKKIAYESGSTSDLLLNYALQQNGMTISDVQPVPMSAADAGAALIAGKVDVAVTYEPYISAALKGNSDYAVLYSAQAKPGLISDVAVAKRAYIEKNPQVMRALTLAWGDAVNFLRQNPAEGGKIIADAAGSSPEDFATSYAGLKIYDLAENKTELNGDYPAAFTEIAKILQTINPDEVKTIPDPSKVINTTFVNAQ
jgi:NitT/TauT family transport system substrate-binding protein